MNETLFSTIQDAIKQNNASIYTALPARVISFNGHTVTCEAMINRSVDGKGTEIPPLVDVVAIFPHANGFHITVPIKAGDEGLVVFASRCIDGWYESGNKGEPMDSRTHDLSDGFFIVGANSLPNKIPDFFNDGISMQTDDGETYVRVTNGTIYMKGNIEHKGNTTQKGNYDQIGSYNQTGGDTKSDGVITAQDVKTNKDIDLNTHTHEGVQSGNSNTGKPV